MRNQIEIPQQKDDRGYDYNVFNFFRNKETHHVNNFYSDQKEKVVSTHRTAGHDVSTHRKTSTPAFSPHQNNLSRELTSTATDYTSK